MNNILDYFVVFSLGIWLSLSIISQFSGIKWVIWLKDRDIFKLIPSWNFFAPYPGVTDYKILYRDRFFDGQFSNWQEIHYRNNSILPSIFNSNKRRRKSIADSCRSLLQNANMNPKNKEIVFSFPYLIILNYIMSMPKNSLSEYRQFLIARTFGYISSKPPDILFLSDQHNLSSKI